MRVLGVCGGNGVILHPFKKHLIGNIEPRADFYNGRGADQWKANFGKIPISKTPDRFKGSTVDVIVGHPDCGHSSSLAYSRGKKLGNAQENDSMKLFVESVQLYKPKIFLFENLPTLFKTYPLKDLEEQWKGYKLLHFTESVARWGNSQLSRVRLVIIGIQEAYFGQYSRYFKLPSKEKLHLKRVKELESKLNYPDIFLMHIREPGNRVVCMEKDFKKLTLTEIKEIWNSEPYKNRKKWDATTTGKGKMKNLPGVYRNLADEFPLTARKQNRQFNSKGDIMSPRELARIQGIPDEFRLHLGEPHVWYWINKGRVTATKCPPYEIGAWFYKCVKKLQKHENNALSTHQGWMEPN